MFVICIAVLVILVGCISSYLISHPLLAKYIKNYILNLLNRQKDAEEGETPTENASVVLKPNRSLGLSLRQVLSLDKEDEVHLESIADNFFQLYEISDAVRRAGLEESNVIIGIDFSASNEWQGRHSFHRKSLHSTSKKHKNPYQKVMTIIPDVLAPFNDDNLIPAFGFGDATTKDKSVFPFKPDGASCVGFREVLERYEEVAERVQLSGPTSLVPIINKAVETTVQHGGYHILLVVMDGQIEEEQDEDTQFAIVEASMYPLSIIMVGVGDGPFDRMHSYDDKLPARQFDNFHFVDYHKCTSEVDATRHATTPEMYFALHALMEIPDQYKRIKALGMLPDGGVNREERRKGEEDEAEARRRRYSEAKQGHVPRLTVSAEFNE